MNSRGYFMTFLRAIKNNESTILAVFLFGFLGCLLWVRPTNTHHVLFKSSSHVSRLWPLHQPVIMSVLEIVRHLKPSRSPSGEVPLPLLKEVFPSVFTGLNRALCSPTLPKMLKHAMVEPLFKKPALDLTTLSNFRPTTAISLKKILEKLIYGRLCPLVRPSYVGSRKIQA